MAKNKPPRFVIVGDVHFAMDPPGRRKDGYADSVLGKLQFAATVGSKLGVDGFIFTGDVFHHKRASIREVNAMLEAFSEFQSDVHVLIGNHDVIGHNTDDLEGSGIGALFHLDHVHRIPREPDGCEVVITGADYQPDYETSAPYDPITTHDDGRPHIHVTHGTLLESELPFEVSRTLIGEIEHNIADHKNVLLVNGHWHKPWQREKSNVWNLGSFSRCAFGENHTPRILVAEWATDEWKVRPVDVPCETDVWEPENEIVKALDRDAVAEFVESFEAEENVELRSEELLGTLLEGKSDEVRGMVRELLEGEAA